MTEKGSESESGREVKLSHDKGPNGNLNMSPVGQSRQSIKMARKNKTKPTTTARESIKKEKQVFDLIASAAAACMRLVACTTASECGTPHETETEPDPSN